jgi:hypothetical protein
MLSFLFSLESIINDKLIGPPVRWITGQVYRWLTPLVIVGILLISAALGYKGSARQLQMVIVLPFVVGGALALLRWPQLGLLLLVGSIAVPFSGPSNSNLTLGVAALILGLWIFEMLVIERKVQLISSITIKPLFALVLVSILAFGVGQLPWYIFASSAPLGAQLGGLSLYILSAGVFLVTVHRIQDIYWLKWMTWLFLGLGAIVIIGRLGGGQQINALFNTGATGSLFWVWLLTLSFSQAILNEELSIRWRVALGGLACATLYVMMTQLWEWNSGWTPALASAAVIGFMAFPRLGMGGIVIGILLGLMKLPSIINAVMVGDNEYSLATRLEAWIILWNVVKVNPILGLGPANYSWYTPLFPIRGYAVQFNSHQQYADLILQTGIMGLFCFIWFFAAVGWVAWQLHKRVQSGFIKAYVYGALGGVAGTFASAAFGDWVIPYFYNINLGGFRASMLSWLFLGGLVALDQMVRNKTIMAGEKSP